MLECVNYVVAAREVVDCHDHIGFNENSTHFDQGTLWWSTFEHVLTVAFATARMSSAALFLYFRNHSNHNHVLHCISVQISAIVSSCGI